MYAVTFPLDELDPDEPPLVDICRSDGLLFAHADRGFAARGILRRVPVERTLEVLASIDHHGIGIDLAQPVAFGALPFDAAETAECIIPELIVGKDRQSSWVTVIAETPIDDPHERARDLLGNPVRPSPASADYRIGHLAPIEHYLDAVIAAREAVTRGEIDKAVIARQIAVKSNQPFDIHGVLARLETMFATSYRYSIDGLVGASPELLVEVIGDRIASHPLAGTAPRTGDPVTDQHLATRLIASTKDQLEHRVVIEMVHDTLLPYVSYLDAEPEPSIVTVANVQHLGTRVEGRLSQPSPSSLHLARELAPTPALGGHPRQEALELISAVEGITRGRYGGAVGWVTATGEGTWAVTIRCAEFSPDRHRAILTAGGGIVAASDPLVELAETQAKFQAMLSALIRP